MPCFEPNHYYSGLPSIFGASIATRNIDTSTYLTPNYNGGNVTLQATSGNINVGNITSGSSLNTPSAGDAGNGGTIYIEALYGRINTGSIRSVSNVTNITGNARNGGSITINAQDITTDYIQSLVVLNSNGQARSKAL